MSLSRKAAVIGVGVAAVAAAGLALPAVASASHPLGTGGVLAVTCIRPAAGYQPVEAAVAPVGSDTPRNALVAAEGGVEKADSMAQSKCSLSGIAATRVQVDRLELDYVGTGTHHIYKQAGPVNSGAGKVAELVTPGQGSLPCANDLAIRMYFSVRYADNHLARFSMSGPVFHRCAS
jgi:hypothetical protein